MSRPNACFVAFGLAQAITMAKFACWESAAVTLLVTWRGDSV